MQMEQRTGEPGSEAEGEIIRVYSVSWVGDNGQPGSQTVQEGASCYISSGKKEETSMQEVIFCSFQMAGGAEQLWKMRYKTLDNQYRTVLPGAVAERFLLPQVEHWGLRASVHIDQAARSSGEAAEGQQPHQEGSRPDRCLPQKRQRSATQMEARRAKASMIKDACGVLQQNGKWQGSAVTVFTASEKEWEGFKLTRQCPVQCFWHGALCGTQKRSPSIDAAPVQ